MTGEVPDWVRQARDTWTNRGDRRPSFALAPGAGQESVWDYPRPPAVVVDDRRVEVTAPDGSIVASTDRSVRVLETSLAPSFYIPPDDVAAERLVVVAGASHCEWKGEAEYLALVPAGGGRAGGSWVAWRYPTPYPDFAGLAGWVSFHPGRIRCAVDAEVARAQPGGFYGGWITDEVVGPFKGEPGTSHW